MVNGISLTKFMNSTLLALPLAGSSTPQSFTNFAAFVKTAQKHFSLLSQTLLAPKFAFMTVFTTLRTLPAHHKKPSSKFRILVGTITGARNRFDNGAWIDNPAGLEGTLLFGEGRNPTDVTAAATVYIDPSYHTHNVSGTTTIDNVNIGVTGNVAADAAADNPDDMWTGSIVLLCPSGLTLSAVGNIANGPYTTTSVDAVRLHWQTNDTWIIEK